MANLRDTNPSDFTEKHKADQKGFTGEHHSVDPTVLAKHLASHVTTPVNQLDTNDTADSGNVDQKPSSAQELSSEKGDAQRRTGSTEAKR
jgi:hypothetical protein